VLIGTSLGLPLRRSPCRWRRARAGDGAEQVLGIGLGGRDRSAAVVGAIGQMLNEGYA